MAGSQISPLSALADTSFLYAVIDRGSKEHQKAVNFYDSFAHLILVPTITLAELSYLIHQLGGSHHVVKTMRALWASQVEFIDLIPPDYRRALDILEKYADSRIDFVDAGIMALAERLKVVRILTYDHRDFGLYRPVHIERFELLP